MTFYIRIHNSAEGPGLFLDVLTVEGIPYRIIEPGAPLPPLDGKAGDAVLSMGGPQSANDRTPAMQAEIRWLRRIIRDDIPYLGICLGHQVLGRAAGGSVTRHGAPEIGWRDPSGRMYQMSFTPLGLSDPLFHGSGREIPVFQLHHEMVIPHASTRLLATGTGGSCQAIRVARRAYGIQGHCEVTRVLLEAWCTQDRDLARQSIDTVREDDRTVRTRYESCSFQIFRNFLSVAGLL